jgi:hypothetical protein
MKQAPRINCGRVSAPIPYPDTTQRPVGAAFFVLATRKGWRDVPLEMEDIHGTYNYDE